MVDFQALHDSLHSRKLTEPFSVRELKTWLGVSETTAKKFLSREIAEGHIVFFGKSTNKYQIGPKPILYRLAHVCSSHPDAPEIADVSAT